MIPNYAELPDARPLVYLDQNVIDALKKNKLQNLLPLFKSSYRAIYSNETLKEIRRAGTNGKEADASSLLSILEDIGAYHIHQCFDEHMHPEDSVVVRSHSPFLIYEEYCENTDFDYVEAAMQLKLRKFSGGLTETSFDEISDAEIEAFEGLGTYIDANIEELKELVPEGFEFPEINADIDVEKFKKLALDFKELLKSDIKSDGTNWSAIEDFREALNLTPVVLNNIGPPNVIEKIWDVLAKNEHIRVSDLTINKYFGLETQNPIYPYRKTYKSELALGVYHHLNYIGYFPDKKVNIDKYFTSSFSDMSHISIASYCSYLLSCDMRLCKKAEAAFEYLDIKTSVMYLDMKATP